MSTNDAERNDSDLVYPDEYLVEQDQDGFSGPQDVLLRYLIGELERFATINRFRPVEVESGRNLTFNETSNYFLIGLGQFV